MKNLKTKIKVGSSVGYLTQRRKRWYIRYRLIPNGKVIIETLGTDDYRTALIEAEKFLTNLEEEKLGGYRLSELPKIWLRANSQKSEWYKKDIDKHWKIFIKYFEDCYAFKMTRDDLDQYKRYIETSYVTKFEDRLSSTTVHNNLKVIKTVWNWHRKRDNVKEDITLLLELPKAKTRQGWLTPKMLIKLIDSASDNKLYQAFIEFLIYTGWRPAEFHQLKWLDIQDQFIIMHDTKTGDYTVSNRKRMKDTLNKIKQHQNQQTTYVCSDSTGKHFSYYTLLNIVKRYLKKIELNDYTPYHLRHSFCTNLYLWKKDIYLVQKLARHKHIQTTLKYTKLDENTVPDENVDFMKDVMYEKEESEKLFSDAYIAELDRDGYLVSDKYGSDITTQLVEGGTIFYVVPCGQGFRKINDSEDHFDNCFECHKLSNRILVKKSDLII